MNGPMFPALLPVLPEIVLAGAERWPPAVDAQVRFRGEHSARLCHWGGDPAAGNRRRHLGWPAWRQARHHLAAASGRPFRDAFPQLFGERGFGGRRASFRLTFLRSESRRIANIRS